MNLSDRISTLVEHSGLSVKALSEKLGFKTPQLLYELIKGNTMTLSKRVQDSILNTFPEVNRVWLLTGEGDMLNIATADVVDPERTIYDGLKTVPLIPIFAQAGSLSCFADSAMLRDCELIVSPIKDAEYAMRVAGDSMSPEYPNGSQVLIKKINPNMFIDWGKVFVLDTYNGSVMKVLAPGSQPDRVKCISKNPDPIFAPFEVRWEDIIGVYRVLLCMSVK